MIDKAEGAPWGTTGLTTAEWRKIPPQVVVVSSLTATQRGVYFEHLAADHQLREGGDEFPHVVAHAGRLYLEDGHHKVMRKLLAGRVYVWARVFSV